jgi:16S rRNA (guanine1516-N2)-methyltransferase
MHPPRNKSALVKAEMRQIRAIVGIDDDQTRLMQTALAHASTACCAEMASQGRTNGRYPASITSDHW